MRDQKGCLAVMVEGPARQPWPLWRRMAFMAALSVVCGLSAELYMTQLLTCAALGEHEGGRDGEV